jgi:putative chitinase
MSILITPVQVKQIATKVSGGIIGAVTQALNDTMARFNINTTVTRVRYFVSQLAFESSDFSVTTENLNYSAQRLVGVWPNRFTAVTAPAYAYNPKALANLVYANRNGNGNAASGDGFTFRGRGYIQLTGRANYTSASQFIYGDNRLVTSPDQVATDPEIAAMTAGWFWNDKNLNALADQLNFTAVTLKINGSTDTVANRRVYLARANVAIA